MRTIYDPKGNPDFYVTSRTLGDGEFDVTLTNLGSDYTPPTIEDFAMLPGSIDTASYLPMTDVNVDSGGWFDSITNAFGSLGSTAMDALGKTIPGLVNLGVRQAIGQNTASTGGTPVVGTGAPQVVKSNVPASGNRYTIMGASANSMLPLLLLGGGAILVFAMMKKR